MRRLALAIVALAAAPALAQTPSSGIDWSKPVEGVDDIAPLIARIENHTLRVDLKPASAAESRAAQEFARSINAATPLPPPCEPPLPRAPAEPPGPPLPAPAPCRP